MTILFIPHEQNLTTLQIIDHVYLRISIIFAYNPVCGRYSITFFVPTLYIIHIQNRSSIYIYIYTYLCVYICIYIYTHTHTNTHTHICKYEKCMTGRRLARVILNMALCTYDSCGFYLSPVERTSSTY